MPAVPAVPNPADLAAKGQALQADAIADIKKAVPPMPQEAVVLQHEVRKKKRELSRLQPMSLDELKAKEQLVAEYEERAPRVDKDIIKEEMDRIESQRAEIMSTIKNDSEKLDVLYPESMRIALKE